MQVDRENEVGQIRGEIELWAANSDSGYGRGGILSPLVLICTKKSFYGRVNQYFMLARVSLNER
jgi:hypothetical protein